MIEPKPKGWYEGAPDATKRERRLRRMAGRLHATMKRAETIGATDEERAELIAHIDAMLVVALEMNSEEPRALGWERVEKGSPEAHDRTETLERNAEAYRREVRALPGRLASPPAGVSAAEFDRALDKAGG